MECGQVKKLTAYALFHYREFLKLFTGGETGEGKIPMRKLEHTPKLMPNNHNVYIQSRGILGRMPRSGLIYIQRGMLI